MRDRARGWWVASLLLGGIACDDGGAAPPAAPTDPDVQSEDSPSEDLGLPVCEVPSEPTALLTYLRSGAYKGFASESAPHPSTGPHGGRVLTYVNDLLAESLDASNAEHPRCAASVKELFLGKSEVSGWAVFVKTEQRSDKGRGYYWYEITSTRSGARSDYEGQGINICVGCHSAGRDQFRAPWPLQ
jgi:hypothetical protein